jgi:hypothetical protein
MRLVFGALSLLVVLAIVGSIAKKQLHALTGGAATGAPAVTAHGRDPADPPAADSAGMTVPQQAQDIAQQVRRDTARALQQGADRNARAEP